MCSYGCVPQIHSWFHEERLCDTSALFHFSGRWVKETWQEMLVAQDMVQHLVVSVTCHTNFTVEKQCSYAIMVTIMNSPAGWESSPRNTHAFHCLPFMASFHSSFLSLPTVTMEAFTWGPSLGTRCSFVTILLPGSPRQPQLRLLVDIGSHLGVSFEAGAWRTLMIGISSSGWHIHVEDFQSI